MAIATLLAWCNACSGRGMQPLIIGWNRVAGTRYRPRTGSRRDATLGPSIRIRWKGVRVRARMRRGGE